MNIEQISVFVENKTGRLSEIMQVISENSIDIRALSIADTTNFGILRLIVNKPKLAEEKLKQAGCTVSLTTVIALGVDDRPGGLSTALTSLNEVNISVEYMYAFISRELKKAYVILRVEDNDKAIEVLRQHKIPILSSKDVYEM